MTTHTASVPNHHAGHGAFSGLPGWLVALSLRFNRTGDARLAADLVDLRAGDHVVDIGCGPGVALVHAVERGAKATGVDPAAIMLRTAQRRTRRASGVEVLDGRAEALPLADDSATAAWSLATVHHWPDIAGGLAEIRRVLRPAGRFVALERRTHAGAKGLASHGWTDDQAEAFAAACRQAGLVDVAVSRHSGTRGRHSSTLAVLARTPD